MRWQWADRLVFILFFNISKRRWGGSRRASAAAGAAATRAALPPLEGGWQWQAVRGSLPWQENGSEMAVAVCRGRADEASVDRHEAREFLEPILHQDDLRLPIADVERGFDPRGRAELECPPYGLSCRGWSRVRPRRRKWQASQSG